MFSLAGDIILKCCHTIAVSGTAKYAEFHLHKSDEIQGLRSITWQNGKTWFEFRATSKKVFLCISFALLFRLVALGSYRSARAKSWEKERKLFMYIEFEITKDTYCQWLPSRINLEDETLFICLFLTVNKWDSQKKSLGRFQGTSKS